MNKRQEEKSERLHQEQIQRYHQIHDLHAKKVDTATIARQVGVSRRTVYYYLKMTEPPTRTRINPHYKPLIEPYKEYVIKRWNEGCRNAQQIHRELEEQSIPELKSFAQGLKKDYDAVKAGLTLPWSQGPVEGHVHRLKLLKRQSYGRTSFQTLRKRVLRCG